MLFIFFLSLIACQPSGEITDDTTTVDLRPKVRTVKVTEQDFVQKVRVPATIQAIKTAVLVPKVPGRIAKIEVRIGDTVDRKALLLQLERGDYQAGYQESKAANELAQMQAEQAQTHLARFQQLLQNFLEQWLS